METPRVAIAVNIGLFTSLSLPLWCVSVSPCLSPIPHLIVFEIHVLVWCVCVAASGEGGRVCEGHAGSRSEQGQHQCCCSACLPGESAWYDVCLVFVLFVFIPTIPKRKQKDKHERKKNGDFCDFFILFFLQK